MSQVSAGESRIPMKTMITTSLFLASIPPAIINIIIIISCSRRRRRFASLRWFGEEQLRQMKYLRHCLFVLLKTDPETDDMSFCCCCRRFARGPLGSTS
jgi:hypothetical protein